MACLVVYLKVVARFNFWVTSQEITRNSAACHAKGGGSGLMRRSRIIGNFSCRQSGKSNLRA